MTDAQTHTFVCPECRRSIEVDDAMRATLLDAGCVVCGAVVTEADIDSPPFARTPAADRLS
ncbi:TFIIB-type zinc ribbon-containing protein [Halorubrum laminariae]|uniref:TFIIB-type zinc ribbon-containing protein n=1 Tax=Halorubrum laminariae TaxID=1433523 RepID=A0ABD6C032_9EURY|nr:TFIIB-type zinc ribbon-containing protein [Halorubrum laminariae]